MKLEDIERLKSICEENGFEIKSESKSGLLYYIDKKDLWEGVEFISLDIDGTIFRVKEVRNSKILVYSDIDGAFICKNDGTPSTESEYVEQLKKEAFERLGEIKDGDMFDCSFWGGNKPAEYSRSANKWRYEKNFDMLTLDHFCLYNSGKWATKLPERVNVEFVGGYNLTKRVRFDFNSSSRISMDEKLGNFLAKQLENYLNDNQE